MGFNSAPRMRYAASFTRTIAGLWRLVAAFVCMGGLSASAMTVTFPPSTPVLQAGAVQHSGTATFRLAASAGAGAALTVESRVAFADDWSGGQRAIWLAGLASRADRAPTALSLAWVQDTSGWLPVWALQLRSDAGLIPAALQPHTDKDGVQSIDLIQGMPSKGHTYQAELSYAAGGRAVSVRVTDVQADQKVYAGGFALRPYVGELWGGAGFAGSAASDAAVALRDLRVVAGFVPVGTDWSLMSRTANGAVPVHQFAVGDKVSLRLEIPGLNPDGEYDVFDVQGSRSLALGSVDGVAGERWLTVPASRLPLGRSTIQLRYVENGVTLLTDRTAVVIGHVHPVFAPVTIDRQAGVLRGSVELTTDQAMPALHLTLQAALSERVWDAQARAFEAGAMYSVNLLEQDVDVSPKPARLDFTVPLAKLGQPGYLQIAFKPEFTQGVAVDSSGASQSVSTYLPADRLDQKPFTIVTLPDIQNYTQYYPEVFTRQTQWIAAHARQFNIGLVIGLGDVTNCDQPYQWQNARDGFDLLGGIVPYVLVEGNHDTPGCGGAHDRDASLMNAYFPVSEARAHSALKGSFPPGRIQNSYSLVDLGGMHFLVIALEFAPSDADLDWANQVAAQYPDRTLIFATHGLTGSNGALTVSGIDNYAVAKDPQYHANNGPAMWDKFISKHAGMLMTLSGHIFSSWTGIPRQVQTGDHGNPVFEMLADYQGEAHGGDGWLVLYTFEPDGKIYVREYSPYLGTYREAWDDDGFSSAFVIDPATGQYTLP